MHRSNLGSGQPSPVVRVSPPGVRVFDREGQAVVYGGHVEDGGKSLVLVLALDLVVLDQPVIIAPVSVPDDVVQHDQPLELELEVPGCLGVQGLLLKPGGGRK